MANKPSIPKGTRDFSPVEMAKRNYIFDTIRSVYALYGFQQIETPAMETLHTLMGKYGEEGDKLLFKVLNSGDYLNKIKSMVDDIKDIMFAFKSSLESRINFELERLNIIDQELKEFSLSQESISFFNELN